MTDLSDNLRVLARASRASLKSCEAMEDAANEIERLNRVVVLVGQDLSLIVAKHAIGKDRTARRMTKYLNAERKK